MILCAPITLYNSNKMSKDYKSSEIHPAFACSRWPPWFPDLSRPYGACVKRGSGKHMFGLTLFRSSRQSKISTSGEERFRYPLPWANKIHQMPYPRANKDNQIPTPCPAFPPNPHRLYIDRCISWPNFSQIGSWVANLDFTCPDFHFEKTGEKDFWQSITHDEIITDYNAKAVNVDL